MSTVYLRRSDESVDRIVRAAFPGYRGKKIRAVIGETISLYGTMWAGGSRRSYVFVRLSDMETMSVPREQYLIKSELHHRSYEIPPGFVVVVYDEFGTYESIEIHSSAENITPLLPPPSNLTDDERIVLQATRSLKSSYGGEKDYRFEESRRNTGITKERWETAKKSLKERKLLNGAGAITVEGRNALN